MDEVVGVVHGVCLDGVVYDIRERRTSSGSIFGGEGEIWVIRFWMRGRPMWAL